MQNDLITLTSAPHPFELATATVPVPAGQSLAQMLVMVQADPILRTHAIAFIDGEMIPREQWTTYYPAPGTLVEIRVLPMGGGGGGGKDTLRVVLQLAVLVASIYIPGIAALGLNAAGKAFLQAGIAIVGNLAINALVPVEQPKGPKESDQLIGIDGFQNRARPFDTVAQVLGRHRIAPDYGARVFTEIIGKDQYLRAIFVWGVGPLNIETDSLRIGDTPLENFEGVEIEHRQGYDTDAPLTLYSDQVAEDSLSIRLGDQTTGSVDLTGPQIRTASAEADELGIDIAFPGGLFGTGENTGNTLSASVSITVEYREVGTTTWLTPTFTAKTFPDSAVSGNTLTFGGKIKGAIRHGMTWAVPRGDYEVKVEVVSMYSSSNPRTSDTYWTALRAIKDEDPISSRVPVAKTAIRIKATDQLNGVLDEFNGIVQTIGKDYFAEPINDWVDDQFIKDPAALFRNILQGKANAIPLPDSRINLPSLQAFRAHCADKGFECNLIVTSGESVWNILRRVAACGRASPAEIDGKWGVVIDQPQAVPVSHITPRNSSNFKSEKAFIELPHAFRIPFVNEDENWRRDEKRVYRSGFDATNATEFEELQLPGVTNSDQVELLGRYRMAQGIQQPERYSFRQDMEFLTYQRGDRVKITHDVLLVGLHSGRVKDVITDGSNNVTGLVLDEQVGMESGKSYGISIRTLDDPAVSRGVTTVAGFQDTVTLSSAISAVGGAPAVRKHDIFGFGLFGSETDDAQIISIKPSTQSEADIIAVPYREVIYGGDDVAIPPFDPNITPIENRPPAPIVREVISDERVAATDGTGSVRIRVGFDVDPLPVTSRFVGAALVIQQRSSNIDEPWSNSTIEERTDGRIIIGGVEEGETLDFRLRWVPPNNRLPSPWTVVSDHVVAGRAASLVAPVISVEAIVAADKDGTGIRPEILLTWVDDSPQGSDRLSYETQTKPFDVAGPSNIVDVKRERTEIQNVLPDQDYEVRARYMMGNTIVWSNWMPVTTTDTRTVAEISDDLRDRIDTAFDRHDQALGTLEPGGTVFQLFEEVKSRDTTLDFDALLRDAILSVENVTGNALTVVQEEKTDLTNATITNDYYTKATADSAIAGQLTTFESNLIDPDGNSLGATLFKNYYTKVDIGSAESGLLQGFRSELEDPNGLYIGATIAQEYYTKVDIGSATSGVLFNFRSEIEDPNGNSLGAKIEQEYYTKVDIGSATSGVLQTFRSELEDPNGNFIGAEVSDIQATKVDADGAVAAVETEISATYNGLTAMATATQFAENTVDGIQSGFVFELDGNDILSLVKVQDGTTSPTTTARIKSDFIKLDGDVEVDGTFLVDQANITSLTVDRLNIADNSATFADFSERTSQLSGTGALQFVDSATVSVPAGETAEILINVSLSQGYTGGQRDWGFQIRRNFGVGFVTLLDRDGMVAQNDYPAITYLDEIDNSAGTSAESVTVEIRWKGEDTTLKLYRGNITLFARIR